MSKRLTFCYVCDRDLLSVGLPRMIDEADSCRKKL